MMCDMYAICRMLDGSFSLHKLKPDGDETPMTTSAEHIKKLIKKDALFGSGDFVMVEVNAFQEFFTGGGELTGEERRLLVPAVTYLSRDRKVLWIVPLTVDDVKLPRLSRGMYEPGGGYINPTFLFEKPKKKGGAE